MAHNTDRLPNRIIPVGDDGERDYDAALAKHGLHGDGERIRVGEMKFAYRGWAELDDGRTAVDLEPVNALARTSRYGQLLAKEPSSGPTLSAPALCWTLYDGVLEFPDGTEFSIESLSPVAQVQVSRVTAAEAADLLRSYASHLDGGVEETALRRARELERALGHDVE